jgi:hypothetical protein
LGTVAEVLTMCCFFDKYWRGVGSYKKEKVFSFLDLKRPHLARLTSVA